MILSDKTIADNLLSDRIGVQPHPSSEQIQPASLDVCLGKELYDVTTDTLYEDGPHTIKPSHCYLAYTQEQITLPNDLAGHLTGRSTLGRMFVTVHQTAGWLDPGFSGTVELEITNFDEEQTLEVGDRIAQVVFMPLDQPSSGYDGQYQGQMGITEAGDI